MSKRPCYLGLLIAASALYLCILAPGGECQSEAVLHAFTSDGDGAVSYGALLRDRAGILYGTTQEGGNIFATASPSFTCLFPFKGCGTVFELTPPSVSLTGQWRSKVLYRFQGGADGAFPQSELTAGPDGKVYGTTYGGGGKGPMNFGGCGTVFQLTPSGNGATQRVLYRFSGSPDGCSPSAEVVSDREGNLYGTTAYGGASNCGPYGECGTVFELSRIEGGWTETTIHTFVYDDGANPLAGLAMDDAGNLYGTTVGGGLGNGVIFELVNTDGTWNERIIYEYGGAPNDGEPAGGVALDHDGNLYGATEFAGDFGYGSVYELSQSQSVWTNATLFSFNGYDGWFPHAGVILGKDGNIYGTTLGSTSGNCLQGCGLVFELDHSQGWSETILHSFAGGTDGAYPWAPLVLDDSGNVYGTTVAGGDPNCSTGSFPPGCGVVFRITP